MSDRYLLVIEDDDTLRELYEAALTSVGYSVLTAADGAAGLAILEQHDVALVLCDEFMSPMSGHEFLQQSRLLARPLPVLMISGYANIRQAVEAMRDGAVDYLIKPVTTQELLAAVEAHFPAAEVEPDQPSGMVAMATSSKELVALARRVALTDATVLITGPSGCGKEVMARFIHQQSERLNGPFVAINCAAIPSSMLEATLFGYEKGAFTNALQATPGKFEQAQGGTLLLDEISEMSLDLQAKLLRVLQEREVERLGGRGVVKLDLRIIATSNRDLPATVRDGHFREDLYFRLSVFPLRLQSLAERPADIIPLAEAMLIKYGEPVSRLTPEAANRLLGHSWPGNVRELENLIQRSLILADDQPIRGYHLQFDPCVDEQVEYVDPLANIRVMADSQAGSHPASQSDVTNRVDEMTGASLRDSLRDQEQQRLIDALASCRTRKAAAGYLGISERTLRYKLARLREQGIELPRSRRAAH